MRQFVFALLVFTCAVSAQTKKVIANLSPEMTAELAKTAPNVKIVPARNADLAKEIVDADAIVGVRLTPELLKQAKQLKWLHISSAGVEPHGNQTGLFPELIESNVVVTNAKNVYGPQIADHAFAFLLALTRKLNITIPRQNLEEWPQGREGMYELDGKTAVIIGVGGIGSQIAQRAHGFGMKVIGVDIRDIPRNNIIQRVVPPDMLDSVLPEADVVFVAVPHTKKSEGMMGARQFELMKQGSYFIAISRGKIYDHAALAKALDSKRIAGAGLDATEPEPLPKGHALWKFPNVVITPHSSGGSDNLQARQNYLVRENIRRFGAGLQLLNLVDKKEGF
ncbi:MAG TPA: D-2-hydroxyacid dehydrogenase [Bryobacteraceae bacterium]|nr:D-2-hydroxyacid dehydrogenase [Bryobacteraceae bacterium]